MDWLFLVGGAVAFFIVFVLPDLAEDWIKRGEKVEAERRKAEEAIARTAEAKVKAAEHELRLTEAKIRLAELESERRFTERQLGS